MFQCLFSTCISVHSCLLFSELFKTNYAYQCRSNVTVTSKLKEALDYLITSYSVVIYGAAGEGKTVCAYQLAKTLIDQGFIKQDKCALICKPNDIRDVKSDDVDLILIDNIFGKHNADQTKLLKWRDYFETLESFKLSRKVRIIIASRLHIMLEYSNELKSYSVFANKVQLHSGELTKHEKQEILVCQLKRFKRHMKEQEIENCVSQHTELGFPLCCQLFASDASDEKLSYLKAELFKPSIKLFLDSGIKVLDVSSVITLIFVFCASNHLKRNELNISTISKESKHMLKQIAELFGNNATIENLVKTTRNSIESLKGSYLKEINGTITFLHNTIYEAIARYMLKECPAVLLERCTIEFFCQCVRLDKCRTDSEVVIETDHMEILAKRCIQEVIHERNAENISTHPAFKSSVFVEEILKQLLKSKELLRDFFSVGVTLKSAGVHGFLYHLLSKEETNKMLFDKAYQHLICYDHSCTYDDECWKCQVKEELLAAVCSSNKHDLYAQLTEDDVHVTPFCLFKAVENPRIQPELVLSIINDLKKYNNFILDEGYIQMSFGLSMRHNNDTVFNILKSNGLRTTVHFLYFAAQKADPCLLSSAINELKKEKKWKADNYYVSRAILESKIQNNASMLDILSTCGAKINEGAVYWAVVDRSYDEVVSIVTTLKHANIFDCESHHLAWTLAVAIKDKNEKLCEFLRKEGVIATPALVAALAELGESAAKIYDAIADLKEDDRWDVENRFIASAYMAASKRANKRLYGLLAKEGVGICPGCFYYAIIWYVGDVKNVMQTLKSTDRFQPDNTILARSLVWAIEYRDSDYVKWLEEEGLDFNMACLVPAVERSFSLSTLETVIENIKAADKWDISCDLALVALNRACNRQDKTAYELLISEGITWCSRSLFLATKHETLYGLKQVLEILMETDSLEPSNIEIKNAVALAKSFKGWQKYREIKKSLQGK